MLDLIYLWILSYLCDNLDKYIMIYIYLLEIHFPIKTFYQHLHFYHIFLGGAHVEVQGQLAGVGLSFHYLSPKDQTQATRLGTSGCFSLLSHLTNPLIGMFSWNLLGESYDKTVL